MKKHAVICQNLSRTFSNIFAVDKLSFNVSYGEIFSLMGPNGAGKTTTMRILAGILPATSGYCKIIDYDIYKDVTSIKTITGLLPESSGIYENLTSTEFLLFIASLYNIPIKLVKERIDYYFKLLDVQYPNRMLTDLSRGMRQKIMFISAMIHNPKLILLDEPIATLDPIIAARLKEHIKKQASQDKAIIISSHNSNLVEELSNRVLFMHKGTSIASGTPRSLKEEYQVDTLEKAYIVAINEQDNIVQ